jgi:asparagine synthase (glutamine-hydrolysing)
MCGICGFIDFNKKTDLDVLQHMNNTLTHRGPDGEGYYLKKTDEAFVGLGHRRLRIIDLSDGGSQPQTFKSFHITFNGEIYNYKEIRKELESKAHCFCTKSDTEVILHAYDEWGNKALDRFIGMFAFVIFDEENRKVFIARDRAGVKPLFYYWNNGLFLFASELKSLLQHPSFAKEINNDAVAAFMQYGYVPTPHCIYKNSHKLTPGHFLEFNLKSRTFVEHQYWNVYDSYNKPALQISFRDAVEETERLLNDAFQYRMVSDVPVGVFLSGGYDSSCVTALLQKNNMDKIKTFSIGIRDAELNEAPFAKNIAKILGTDHTEFYCTEKEALEILPMMPFYYDEPSSDSCAIPTILVSRIAKQKVAVALSADGGDEIFSGYKRYSYAEKYGKKLQMIPSPLRKTMAGLMTFLSTSILPQSIRGHYFCSRYEKIKMVLQNPCEKNVLKCLAQQFDDRELCCMMKPKVNKIHTAFDKSELCSQNYSLPAFMMAMDYQTYLVDDILQKVDRATMSISLEGREPFLDQRIIEWAAQLPIEYKTYHGRNKLLLKEIVHHYLPKEIMDRPKRGFGIPVKTWLYGDLKKIVDHYLSEQFIARQNLFNARKLLYIKNSFYHGKMEWTDKLWNLLIFQMWYDKWINNQEATGF